ncbi:hypothetical protein D3C81_1600850 [compost metagenome]
MPCMDEAQQAEGRAVLYTLADPDYDQLLHGRAPAQKTCFSGGKVGGGSGAGDAEQRTDRPGTGDAPDEAEIPACCNSQILSGHDSRANCGGAGETGRHDQNLAARRA